MGLKQSVSTILLSLGLLFPYPLGTIQAQSITEVKPSVSAACFRTIASKIEPIINRSELVRSHWGIFVQSLDNQTIIYDLNGDKWFVPASNLKLITTASALLQFGADFRIETPFYGTGSAPNLKTLTVVGKGDPTITTTQLQVIAQTLKNQGIKQIDTLIIDDSYFQATGINPTWEWEDIFYAYAPSINSISLNENAVTLTLIPQALDQPLKLEWSDPLATTEWKIINRTNTVNKGEDSPLIIKGKFGDSTLEIRGNLAVATAPETFEMTVINPPQYFLKVFKNLLNQVGIQVKNTQIITEPAPITHQSLLAQIQSSSLTEMITTTNQDSNNLFAETLLNLLNATDSSLETSLNQINLDTNAYKIVDGSGLSRHNLVTPKGIVQLLEKMANHPTGEVYRNSLAVAGMSGTLKNRFIDTPLVGNLQGKTGTLSGIVSLSGYLETEADETLVFSILINQSEQPATTLRQGMDEILVVLSQLSSC